MDTKAGSGGGFVGWEQDEYVSVGVFFCGSAVLTASSGVPPVVEEELFVLLGDQGLGVVKFGAVGASDERPVAVRAHGNAHTATRSHLLGRHVPGGGAGSGAGSGAGGGAGSGAGGGGGGGGQRAAPPHNSPSSPRDQEGGVQGRRGTVALELSQLRVGP
jgi:hypothetical protein